MRCKGRTEKSGEAPPQTDKVPGRISVAEAHDAGSWMLDKGIPCFIRHRLSNVSSGIGYPMFHPASVIQKLDTFVKFLAYKDG